MEPIKIEKVRKEEKGSYTLFLSNGEEITIDEDLLVRYRLLAGKEIDFRLLSELDEENRIQQGVNLGVYYLSFRPRSSLEVKEYLLHKEVHPDYIKEILSRLQDKGYLDDRVFAYKWVENRRLLKPKGRLALRNELRQKGISAEIIDDILSNLDREHEKEQALELGRKKLRQWQGKSWQEIRPKLSRYLSYRGFEGNLIIEILQILREE